MLISNKTNLITNSLIEIDEAEGNGKGHYFKSRFIEAGIAHYDELGDILITKETLTKFIHSMIGCPVIINHKDITDKNVDKLRVGVISRVWYEPQDGWFYCEGVITDEQAVDLIKNQGWNVSCSYNFVSDNTPRIHNGKKIDMEFTDGEFLHLAIVENPRYEGANIVVNSADKKWSVEESDEEGFVTIKYGEKSWKVPISKLEESNKGFESYINKIISNITKEKFDIEKFDNSGYKYKIRMTEDQYNSKIMEKVKDTFINTNKLAATPIYEEFAGDKYMILEFKNKADNAKDWDGNEGDWITVNGNHLFIKNGQSKDEVVKQFIDKQEDKSNKQPDTKDKSKDSEKKEGKTKEEKNKELEAKMQEGIKKEIKHAHEDKHYTNERDKNYAAIITYIDFRSKIGEWFDNNPDQSEYGAMDALGLWKLDEYKNLSKNNKKKIRDRLQGIWMSRKYKRENANNNIGDITMTVLNDLKDFIMNVVNNEKEKDVEEKDVKNEKVDKRDIIRQIMAIAGKNEDNEDVRTIAKLAEKLAYNPSEDDKADNEIVEEKEEDKKVTENEDEKEEKEEKFEEEKEIANKKAKNEDKEEKADNKCGKAKNSIEETRNILFGGIVKQESDYKTQEERLELGNNY